MVVLVWRFVLLLSAVVGGISGLPFRKAADGEEVSDYVVAFKPEYVVTKILEQVSRQFDLLKRPPRVDYVYDHVLNGLGLSDVNSETLEWLEKQDYVAYVEESHEFTADSGPCITVSPTNQQDYTPDDAQVNWGLDRITERAFTNTYSFDPSGTAYGTVIYVMDSGIRCSHDQFDDTARCDDDFFKYSGAPNYVDSFGHGTQVAGIAAADDLGAATCATIKNVKIADSSGTSDLSKIIAGLNAIAAHVTANNRGNNCVIVISFSGAHDASLNTTITDVTDDDCVIVSSAGNGQSVVPVYPAGYSVTNTKVIAVGNTNKQDKLHCASNHGSWVNIYAPGSNLFTPHKTDDDDIVSVKGTSFSAAIAGGGAAIVLQETGVDASNLRQKLIDRATLDKIKELPANTNSHNRLLYVGTV